MESKRNARRVAHDLKRSGEAGFLGRIASGNHLAAQNDEPEPTLLAGTATAEERRLAAMFGGDADLPLESATAYAQRRARENDARALDLQLNGSGVRS